MKRELTNQELLDRYLHSLTMLLPADKMDDIAAEIRSNLAVARGRSRHAPGAGPAP